MKKVVWSRRAINHLVAIRDHIAQDSPDSAVTIAATILDAVETLRRCPASAAPAESEEHGS